MPTTFHYIMLFFHKIQVQQSLINVDVKLSVIKYSVLNTKVSQNSIVPYVDVTACMTDNYS